MGIALEETANKLLLDLNLGKLIAKGGYREWDVSMDRDQYSDFYDDQYWIPTTVPAEFWGELLNWKDPELLKLEDGYLQLIYRNISLSMYDLKERYFNPKLQRLSDYDVYPTVTIEQALRWIEDKQPPLDEKSERIAGYQQVIKKVNDEDNSIYWLKDQYEGAFTKLLKNLKFGELQAYSETYEKSKDRLLFETGEGKDEDPFFSSNKMNKDNDESPYAFNVPVPADVWDIPDSFRDCRYGSHSLAMHNANKAYYDIHIFFDDLFKLFPVENEECEEEIPAEQALKENVIKPKRGKPPICDKEVWLERLAILSLQGEIDLNDSHESVSQALADDLNKMGIKVAISTIKKDWIGPIIRKAREKDHKGE